MINFPKERGRLSQTEYDFLQAKDRSERMAQSLMKRFKWIKAIRFKGDVKFHPGRNKASAERDAKLGLEVSFGLNMEMTYLDLKNQEKKCEVIFRFKEKPFHNIFFKSYKKNPTIQDLIDQFKNTWIILASGNIPEDPKAYVVAQTKNYPNLCFTPQYDKGKIVKYRIAFGSWAKWVPAKQFDIFGNNSVDEIFERIRK